MHKGMTLRESCPACGARPLDPMMAGLTYGRSQSVLESPETGRKPDRCNVPNKRHWNRKSFFHRSLDTQEQLSPFLRAHQLLAVPQRWTFCLTILYASSILSGGGEKAEKEEVMQGSHLIAGFTAT